MERTLLQMGLYVAVFSVVLWWLIYINWRHPLSYHVVTVELLHDGGLVQKLNALPHARRLIHCLDGHSCLGFVLDHSLCDAFVHHAEGALTQLPVHGDLLPGHLPLVWDVHCHDTDGQPVNSTYKHQNATEELWRCSIILLSAALKYSGLTDAYRTPFPNLSLFLLTQR